MMAKNEFPGWHKDFVEAVAMATRLHQFQTRKVGNIPYMSHVISVSAIVMEQGGQRDATIAALLHDAAEDQGGLQTLKEISEAFGSRVAEIVENCSDTLETPKPEWRARKQRFIDGLPALDAETHLVIAADKLHNLRCLSQAVAAEGEVIWNHFQTGLEGTAWYYREVSDQQRGRISKALQSEISLLIERLFPDGSAQGGN